MSLVLMLVFVDFVLSIIGDSQQCVKQSYGESKERGHVKEWTKNVNDQSAMDLESFIYVLASNYWRGYPYGLDANMASID